MYVVWAIVGAVLGGVIGQGFAGAAAGFAIGLLWARLSQTRRELDELRAQVGGASARPTVPVSSATPVPAPALWPEDLPEGVSPAEMGRPFARPGQASAASPAQSADTVPSGSPATLSPAIPPPMPAAARAAASSASASASATSTADAFSRPPGAAPAAPAGPSAIERLIDTAKRWFTEGNVPVKVGMLVLFAGVAAFLKYAADQGLLHVPISVRLSIVALAAIAGVVFGWMQRDARRSFALSLQGGALGVLVMTVFAAYRLYGLLDPLPTFVLLVVFVGCMGILAVLQDSLALAVLGLIAGFAAPIIASSGQGNHVALFSYYAVLNLGIFGIAWKKAWRILNVLGFVGTFGVGTAWGVLGYRPELFNSTEPFLILFFLLYVAVPWLHVLRSPRHDRAILDGSLMFGTPIISLLLQGALLDWHPMPLAMSALVAAALYVAIAFAIRQREDMRVLRETWAVLAVAFATIAVPLALSASVTACIFALEGAGLVWLGFRQQRRLPRWMGLSLQVFAAFSWGFADLFNTHYLKTPFLNAYFLSAMLMTAGGVACLWQYDRHSTSKGIGSLVRVWLLLWSVAWWLLGFSAEIDIFVQLDAARWAAWMALLAVTGLGLAIGIARVRKLDLGLMLAWSVPLSLAVTAAMGPYANTYGIQVFGGWPLAAVVVAAVTGWFSLRAVATHALAAITAQSLWWARWLAWVFAATQVALGFRPAIGDGWQLLAYAAPTLLVTKLALWWPRAITPPLSMHAQGIRRVVGIGGLALSLLIGAFALTVAGNPAPLPFIPLLNPVELVLIAVFGLLARALWDAETPPGLRSIRPAVLAVAFFIIATSMTLRAVHHLGGVPWDEHMPASSLAELWLTVVWSVTGVVAWVLGSKRGQRLLWMAGAACMAIVLAKLLLIDRGHLGNLFGIASFIAYGLLCTVIGYLAPAPPRQATEHAPESSHAP
ncbi:DUF2339 domain-containing protein [Luteibacter aegosomatissinici]|uniref:DUF2339 domain-containing protein n=1 Tax=Luteibacter aegosomatissinici TaxID=2911539 RepID=UPI001FFA3BE4|nr:DUF2339 domain-containing protein [Luteibacter aegosomatissinici]UPG92880.1 DUF2339 domain-containing protein [Luteibacter aegosomatissinici]